MAKSSSINFAQLISKNKFSFALYFLIYLALASFLSGFYENIPLLFVYAATISWSKLIISFIFTLIIGFLISLNILLLRDRIKERQSCASQGTIATAATLGGLAVGVCPVCVTGVTALILGALGIGFSFAALPFQGLEIQLLLIIILLLNLKLLDRKT